MSSVPPLPPTVFVSRTEMPPVPGAPQVSRGQVIRGWCVMGTVLLGIVLGVVLLLRPPA